MTEFSKGFQNKRPDNTFWDPAFAGPVWVYGTIIFSWLLDLLPTDQWQWFPNLTIITLLYWTIYQSHRIFYWLVFLLGLLTDADTGAVFGQHAFSFCLVVFLTEMLKVRLQWLTPFSQAITLAPIFLIIPILKIVESICFGNPTIQVEWFVAPIISVAIWPFACWVLSRHFYPRGD